MLQLVSSHLFLNSSEQIIPMTIMIMRKTRKGFTLLTLTIKTKRIKVVIGSDEFKSQTLVSNAKCLLCDTKQDNTLQTINPTHAYRHSN